MTDIDRIKLIPRPIVGVEATLNAQAVLQTLGTKVSSLTVTLPIDDFILHLQYNINTLNYEV